MNVICEDMYHQWSYWITLGVWWLNNITINHKWKTTITNTIVLDLNGWQKLKWIVTIIHNHHMGVPSNTVTLYVVVASYCKCTKSITFNLIIVEHFLESVYRLNTTLCGQVWYSTHLLHEIWNWTFWHQACHMEHVVVETSVYCYHAHHHFSEKVKKYFRDHLMDTLVHQYPRQVCIIAVNI